VDDQLAASVALVVCRTFLCVTDQSPAAVIDLLVSVLSIASEVVASSTNQLVVVVACISLAAFNCVKVVFLIIPPSALSAIPILSALTGVVFAVAVFICFLIWSLVATIGAHVPPVAVPASNSDCVDISTLPATVSLAFGFVPLALSAHAPPT